MGRTILQTITSVIACLFLLVVIALGTDAWSKAVGAKPIDGAPIKPPVLTADGKVPTPGNRPVPYAHPPFPTYTPTSTPTGPLPPTNTPTRTNTPTPTPTCDPSWRVVQSPNGGSNNTLTGIAAASANDLWAAGAYTGTNGTQTLLMHWNGNQWSLVPGVDPGTNNRLTGIAAFASDDVWAVGNYTSGSAPLLLTLHWNGAQWVNVPNPGPGSNYAENLQAIGGAAPNDLWAVGFYRHFSPLALIMHWDGNQWSEVTPPQGIVQLNGVWAVSSSDVWAVGMTLNGSPTSVTYHYDGASWSAVSAPDVGTLYGVDGTSSSDVWAAGESGILHWDGASWSAVPTPNAGTIRSVTAIAPNNAWTAGDKILHWDGSTWSIVPRPEPQTSSLLQSVVATGTGAVWAAGYYVYGTQMTLVENYLPCGSTTPTPTPTGSATPTLSSTPSATGTGVATATQSTISTPTGTSTAVPTQTSSPAPATGTPGTPSVTLTPCAITFSDVQSDDYFYEAVRYLYCARAISGYSDGTFRPYNNTTRGQLSKIVVLAEGWAIDTTGGPHFSDVPIDSAFYAYIETAYNHEVISGYSDGTFRWGNNVTRAQLAKIVVSAQGWAIDTTGGPHFSDVGQADPFYGYIETAYNHGIISGYADGTFKPGNSATRGQIGKIVYGAVTGR